jgi:hypothetical protein
MATEGYTPYSLHTLFIGHNIRPNLFKCLEVAISFQSCVSRILTQDLSSKRVRIYAATLPTVPQVSKETFPLLNNVLV